MILGFELTLLCYVLLACVFRLLRPVSIRLALTVLICANIVLLAALNLMLLLYLVGQFGFVLLLYALGKRHPKHSIMLSWMAFLGLIPFNLFVWFGHLEAVDTMLWNIAGIEAAGQIGIGSGAQIVWIVGSTFLVIKSFVMLRESMRVGRLDLMSMIAGLTFLPSYTAGPIHGLDPFKTENIAPVLDLRETAKSVMLFGWGAAALYLLAPNLREVAQEQDLLLVRNQIMFFALYLDFSGYSLVAISIAQFFGVKLPQNFNQPYLATSIREFWQRWHMSLSAFVGTYLFKPFVRKTGSPPKGIFLAFVVVGLWHEVTVQYLLWGIGHGAALSLAMKPPMIWKTTMARLPSLVHKGIGWTMTMLWVASLSAFASAPWPF